MTKERTLIGAQDASRVIDLHHFIVLDTSTIAIGCDRSRVLVDNLWGSISDLKRLVSWRHELHRRISNRGLWRRIKLSDHLPGSLPKERQVSFRMLAPNIVNKHGDALIKVLALDLFELSRRLVLN